MIRLATVSLMISVLCCGSARLTAQDTDVARLEKEVAGLKQEVAQLKGEMAELRRELKALSGLLGPAVAARREANLQKAQADVSALKMTFDMYMIQTRAGELPTWEVLMTPDERGRVWLEGFTRTPRDPWGNDYEVLPGPGARDFEIRSRGPDGKAGTEDDIASRTIRSKR